MAETYLIIYKKMINDHFGEFPPLTPPKGGKNVKFQDFSNFLNSGAQTVNICIFFICSFCPKIICLKSSRTKLADFDDEKKGLAFFRTKNLDFSIFSYIVAPMEARTSPNIFS